jgi:hypothetical protein
MKKNIYGLVAIAIIFLMSCEKKLELNLKAGAPKIVVEGGIETGANPFLILTNSLGFSSAIDLSKIPFAKDAKVSITDVTDNKTIELREYVIDTVFNNQAFKIIFHTIDFAQPAQFDFVGQSNHTYKLNIKYNGKEHLATTKAAAGVLPDSMWAEKVPNSKDSAYLLRVLWDDPDTIGNYNRYETRVLRKDKTVGLNENWLSNFGSVFDDKFNNGAKLPFYLDLGYDKSVNFQDTVSRNKFDLQRSLFKGDTLILKMSGIDYDTYEYWQTLEYSRNSTGNPFAAPTKIKGNFTNGAIGLFGAYDTKFDTLIVK